MIEYNKKCPDSGGKSNEKTFWEFSIALHQIRMWIIE